MKIKKYALLIGSIFLPLILSSSSSMLDNRCQGNIVSLSKMYARLNGDLVDSSETVQKNDNIKSSIKDAKVSSDEIKSNASEALPKKTNLNVKASNNLSGSFSDNVKSVKFKGNRSAVGIILSTLGCCTALYKWFKEDDLQKNLVEENNDITNNQLTNDNYQKAEKSLTLVNSSESIFKNKYYAATGIGLAAVLGYGMYSWYYKNTDNNH